MAARSAVERALGLIWGAGELPARMAREARRQGWRVVAFAFDGAAGFDGVVDRVVPSRLTEVGAVLAAFRAERLGAALLGGSFAMPDILRADTRAGDAGTRAVEARAGSRAGRALYEAIASTFSGIGVELLDQRPFLGDLLPGPGCLTARQPTAEEWAQARRGIALARAMADAGVGQTVVLRRGAVTAVEAVEGTTEAVRRGTALAGPGAVIAKAVARAHDYRFDVPVVGPRTVEAAVAGRAAVIAIEAGRVYLLDRDAVTAAADAAGLSVVSVDDGA